MIRLLGILSGSAVAIAIIIFVVGVPEFVRDVDPEIDPLTSEPVAETTQVFLEPIIVDMPNVDDEPPAVQAAVAAPTENEVLDNATMEPQELMVQSMTETVESTTEVQQWYAFWSPFRSQIAATGFVAQLQRVTGLDYRVVNIKPGVYEVAFAYSDDSEIQASLSQISAATGLDMPES